MNGHDPGLPIEQFIQALTSQLDRAQATLALKARAGLPLTFAVKDLTLDLRTHVEMTGSVVRIRPAGPGEGDTSTIRLQLTTITRPMIEENAVSLAAKPDEPSLREVLGPEVTEDEERRLEWAGIHSVSQLRELERRSGENALEKFTQLPANRLRAALWRASLPRIARITPEPTPPIDRGGTDAQPPLPPTAEVRTPPSQPLPGDDGNGKRGGVRPDFRDLIENQLRDRIVAGPGPKRRPDFIPEMKAPIEPLWPGSIESIQPSFVAPPAIAQPAPVSVGPAPSPSPPPLTVMSPLLPRADVAPIVHQPSIAAPAPPSAPPLLRISGVNLLRGREPRVTIQGERVPVVAATEQEILIAPHPHLLSGTLAVEVEPGVVTETELRLPPQTWTHAPAPNVSGGSP